MNRHQTTVSSATLNAYRLVLLAMVAAAATFSIAVFYPGSQTADEAMELSFGAAYGFIVAQSFVLTLPGLVLGLVLSRLVPRTGALIGTALIFAVPVIVVCDVLTFAWIGERFLSQAMHRITTTLAPGLALHITRSTVVDAVVAVLLGLAVMVLAWWISGRIARRWARSRDPVGPWATTLVMTVVAGLLSIPAVWNLPRTIGEMENQSVRHPLCAFHIVGYRGTGVSVPRGDEATLARLRGLQSAPAVQQIDSRQLQVALDSNTRPSKPAEEFPDIVIIVAESLRHEIISPEVMPNLHAFAEKSIHCQNHFSSGNSTAFGMFTLLTGLDAIWFDRPIANYPILNRVLSAAGYATAFHGGEDDWEEFGMDGFIRRPNFDQFKIEYPKLLETDFRAVQRSVNFLRSPQEVQSISGEPSSSESSAESPDSRFPRLAITYLLNTHCRYISAKQDRVFQPAAPEDFLLPYSAAKRDEIYNRYKNSARTLDRMIKPLLREDCIVIVMGDHGESFLEDGSAIHGLRLSAVQNMTPLIIYYPGVKPREVHQRTTHADIFPTLLSILDLKLDDPETLDGVDLLTTDESELEQRIFTTANMIDRAVGLIGPWTANPDEPFAFRFVYNIGRWQMNYLNPIDAEGYELPPHAENVQVGRQQVQQWLSERIGKDAVRQDLSKRALFTRFLRSANREIRWSALQIAADVAVPEPYLYDLIANLVQDSDQEIRELARELVIRTERYSSQKSR